MNNLRLKHKQLIISAVLICTVFGTSILAQSVKKAVAEDLKFETSELMKNTVWLNPATVYPDSAASGAFGKVNQEWEKTKQGKWYIEEQRYGRDVIIVGIVQKNETQIERGLLILKWGFNQQQPDGSWDCPDTFHSASFFIDAAAQALLLLETSNYGKKYAAEINKMKPQLSKAAQWMVIPKIEENGKKGDYPFVHRNYADAAAIGLTGVLTENKKLIEKSKEYIHEGIARQDASGFNPEKGGYDSLYHAVGMMYAMRYFSIVADKKIRSEMIPMLKKGLAWQASRINQDGTLNTAGNTRVTENIAEKNRDGTPKAVAIRSTFRSFAYWAQVSGDKSYLDLAKKMVAADERKKQAANQKTD